MNFVAFFIFFIALTRKNEHQFELQIFFFILLFFFIIHFLFTLKQLIFYIERQFDVSYKSLFFRTC